MFALAGPEIIDLRPSWLQGSRVLSAHAKQDQFCHVAKIETYSATVAAAVLPALMPDDIGFIVEPLCLHNLQAFRQ